MPSTNGKAGRLWAGWKRAGEKGAHVLGIVIFAFLWLFALGPVALLLKLRGKRLLPHFRGDEETYYLPREPIEPTLESIRRQW